MATITADVYDLPQEHQDFRDTIRQIVDERVRPRAAEIDAHGRVPVGRPQAVRRARHPRRCRSPSEYGGTGTGTLMLQIAVEEIAKACASSALILMVQELGTLPIQLFGTDELQASAGCRAARPASGRRPSRCPSPRPAPTRRRCARPPSATATSGSSTAPRTGSRTPAIADFYVVFARHRPRERARLTAFVVEKDRPGFSIGKLEHKLGIKGSPTGSPVFEDVRVPDENRDRRGRPRAGGRAGHARAHAPRRRRAGRRHRPGRDRLRQRLRQGAHRLRQADPRAPGDRVQARRHGDAHRRRARAALQGVRDGRPRRAAAWASGPRWPSCSPPTPRWR